MKDIGQDAQGDRRFDVTRWPGRDERLRLDDGRHVHLRHYGREGGLPLVMLHGTPGSRILFAGMQALASARDVHVIALDRWAYGGTDAPVVRSLPGFAADVVAVLDQLGIGASAVAGVSGGGPYAAAVASVAPERVLAAGFISPVGLVREASRHGEVAPFHRFCFHTLPRMPGVVTTLFGAYRLAVRANARLACGLTTARAPAADKAIMADCATSDRLLAAFHEGLSRTTQGAAIDLQMFEAIATLDLARATMPTRVWIGTDDGNVPVGAAKRLAARLPRSELTVLDGAGHLWIAAHYDVLLDWIVSAVRSQRLSAPPSP